MPTRSIPSLFFPFLVKSLLPLIPHWHFHLGSSQDSSFEDSNPSLLVSFLDGSSSETVFCEVGSSSKE